MKAYLVFTNICCEKYVVISNSEEDTILYVLRHTTSKNISVGETYKVDEGLIIDVSE